MYHLYPVNLNLQGRKCLVVGGGRVAERKVKSLLQCGAEIWIVSPKLTKGLQDLAEEGAVNILSRHYAEEDLENCFLVISSVDDASVNSRVADDCFRRGIPVNVVDDPARCSYTVPSVLRRGSLCVAVSTEGKSPLLAKRIREQLEELFGPEYAEFLELMGEVRNQVIRDVPSREARRRIFECLIDSDILEIIGENIKQRTSLGSPNARISGRRVRKNRNSEGRASAELHLRDLIEARVEQCIGSRSAECGEKKDLGPPSAEN